MSRFALDVAQFNRRAVRAYAKCGYTVVAEKQVETNGGVYAFFRMEKENGV